MSHRMGGDEGKKNNHRFCPSRVRIRQVRSLTSGKYPVLVRGLKKGTSKNV